MSTELEKQFVEGAARAMFVEAWANREENPPEGLRVVECHDRTDPPDTGTWATLRGTWGEYQPQGHRAFTPWPSGDTIYLFDDEVDSDEPARSRSFAGPLTPDYARHAAWKLLGAFEYANPQWGSNLPSITAAAARADCPNSEENLQERGHIACSLCEDGLDDERARLFGHYVAMTALGHGVSWFDDHATFELSVPSVEFELED